MTERLVVMSGLPGSGKTSFALDLLARLEEQHVPARRVSSDQIRRAMFTRPMRYTQIAHFAVFSRVEVALKEQFDGVTVYDATNVTNIAWASLEGWGVLDGARVVLLSYPEDVVEGRLARRALAGSESDAGWSTSGCATGRCSRPARTTR